MRTRLLSTPPLSGSIEERHYEAFGACTWVEFTPEADLPWVGVFGNQGAASHSGVFEFPNEPFAFVIACGVGWVVNVENGTLAYKTTQECLVTATPYPDQPFVVAADWTNLHIYGIDRQIWSSDRIALDGIRFDKQSHSRSITGECWQGEWRPFQLQNDPWRITFPT